MTAQPTTAPKRGLNIARHWERLPEATRVAIAVVVILVIGSIVIGAIRSMVQTAEPIPPPVVVPTAIVPTAILAPTLQPTAAAAAAVELVMFHDIADPTSTFTVTTELAYVNSSVEGFNSTASGCYLISFGDTKAWTCDPRVIPVIPPTIDYAPQPTPLPAPPVYNQPVYTAPQQRQEAPAAEREEAPLIPLPTAAPLPPTTESNTGSQPRPPIPTADDGLGSTTRPTRSVP